MSEALIAVAPWWPDIARGQFALLAMLAALLVAVYVVGKPVSWFCRKAAIGWRRLFPKIFD
jgi:hypothetical protein